jgi:hypothetical protein
VADETIETVLARPKEAALLGTGVGVQMLLLSRLSFDEDGQPLEYVKSVYRGDRYKFALRTRWSGPGGERLEGQRPDAFLVSVSPTP